MFGDLSKHYLGTILAIAGRQRLRGEQECIVLCMSYGCRQSVMAAQQHVVTFFYLRYKHVWQRSMGKM